MAASHVTEQLGNRRTPPMFLIGAPRSGTTWLQQMLGAHPQIATPPETDLVDRYFAPWLALWSAQAERQTGTHGGRPNKGLPSVLSRVDLHRHLRSIFDAVHEAVLHAKPSASLVLEKHPSYSHHVDLIATLYPEAGFIHLLRDGRDVAASMVRASGTWARGWAPSRVDEAARRWKRSVLGARRAASLTDRYAEVRYEDLLAGTPAVLDEVFALCGVPAEGISRRVIDEFTIDRMKAGASSIVLPSEPEYGRHWEPGTFVGAGGPGSWHREWSAHERSAFHRVAGDLLCELGYEPDDAWVDLSPLSRTVHGMRHVVEDLGQAARRSIGDAIRRRTVDAG